MAKRKWSWKHRIFISSYMKPSDFYALLRFSAEKFGPYQGELSTRWDYTGLLRRNAKFGHVFHNVQLFFRCQEDLVLVKLTYSLPSS